MATTLVTSSYRKTKRGTIIKLVKETYLRSDIHCGRDGCRRCKSFKLSPGQDRFAPPKYLNDDCPRSNIIKTNANERLPNGSHYVCPDSGTLINQIDVISDPEFGQDIILLQTVYKTIRKNINVFSKIRELLASGRMYLFHNEFSKYTARARNEDIESPDDFRRSLCLEAVQWLQKHFETIPIVYLVSEDHDDSIDRPFPIVSIVDYVKSMANDLVDKLAAPKTSKDGGEEFPVYEPHAPLTEVQAGIRDGRLFRGTYRSSPYNFLQGTVTIMRNGEEVTVMIQGRENINRAINDDIVAVEILPKSQWKSVVGDEVIDEEKIQDDEDYDGNDQPKTVKSVENETAVQKPFGKVVSIIKRNWRSYCGVIKEKSPGLERSLNFLFVPVDKRIPFIRIETRQYENIKGKKILVTIDGWPRDSRYPKGHYTRIIGESGDRQTETDVLLLEHQIPHMEFSAQVLNCLPVEGDRWRPSADDLRGRVDFRQECVLSVDPPGCTDIDDALHCRDLGDGTLEVGVHIADVSHFIKAGTALDKEAAERGTTVYLADRRIDMVPGLLSSNLCSLRGGEERLSFSCVWKIRATDGTILDVRFVKSIIKSKAAMTYAEAQLKIDSSERDDISESLRRLNALAKILKAKRIENGALVLASANEIRFLEIESETADNELVIVEKKLLETNSMIEEFMLLANISVAQKIYEVFPEVAVLRRHPKPAASNFEELIVAAKNRGFDINVSDGKSLSQSLDRAVDPQNEHLNLLLRMLATRCMSQALYFCSGALSSDPTLTFFHYGLATEIYTHFTSPIRRYADIMVHRLLSHAISFEMQSPEYLCKRKTITVCDHINVRNMNARRASRSSNELHSYLYLRNAKTPTVQETGHIFTIKRNALIIIILHLSFEVVYMFPDDDDRWEVDQDHGQVVHRPTGSVLRQFDPIQVQLSVQRNVLTSSFKKQIQVKIVKPKIDF